MTTNLKINDVCICYVSWNTGGKVRPILIIRTGETSYVVFKITSSKGNSLATQAHRYAIKRWREAGLDKPSFIDFSQRIELSKMFLTFHQIGHLLRNDQIGLRDAINDYVAKHNNLN